MRLPSSVVIGEEVWPVEELGQPEGLCVTRPTILVRWQGRPKKERINTLLHELLHAAWPDDVVDVQLEERIVSHLANALTPAFLELLRSK